MDVALGINHHNHRGDTNLECLGKRMPWEIIPRTEGYRRVCIDLRKRNAFRIAGWTDGKDLNALRFERFQLPEVVASVGGRVVHFLRYHR